MKYLYLLLTLITIALGGFRPNEVQAQTACCPDFYLSDAVQICPPFGACGSDGAAGQHGFAACKNSVHTYTVFPNDPSFTYTWTVIGGTPAGPNNNPNNILWGNGATGFIKVVITSNNPNLNCADSIMMPVCLIDGPEADFTLAQDTICISNFPNLTNTSLGGSVYTWDMGDGTTYSGNYPPVHYYSSPGTYTITLTATDMGQGQWIPGPQGETLVPCGCSDTATQVVTVIAGTGPEIETDCCYGTVCPGDTSYFCTPMVCSSYNWSVTNGTIISGLGTSCISVKWNATYTGPTTVTLQNCPGSPCGGSTTINVPVLYPNLPISGPTTLCVGASGTYSLPVLPGTFYTWTATGGFSVFNLEDRNVANVNITFNTPGTYWVKCVYDNPLAGCNGVDSLQVDVLPKFVITGNDKVCEMDPTLFSANGPALWSFSPPGPTVLSGNGTPNATIAFPTGSYTIIAVSMNPFTFCNDSAFKTVDVIAKPILNNIMGPDTVCAGNNHTFSISSNTSGSPFVWAVSSGTVISQMGDDNDSIVATFTGSGPWTVSVYQQIEITPGNWCQSATVTKTVYPYPAPSITGNSPVCVDAVETYTISGSTPPGGYQWSISPSNRGTIQSGQGSNAITVKWHGPATTATILVSACSGTASFPVVINDPPIANATPNVTPIFCLNGTQTLVISTPNIGGYTYQWYSTAGILGGETSSSLTINVSSYTMTGTYTYYVIVTNNGCSKQSNMVNVIIKDCTPGGPGGPPIPGNCPATAYFTAYVVCNNITLTNLSSVVPPATITNYQWTISGPGTGTFTPNANAPNPGLTVSASGLYSLTLTVTSSTGCTTSWTEMFNVLLPNASFTVTTPVCENVPALFSASPFSPNYNYAWNFGDGSTSYEANTQHAYVSAALSPYTVTLVITDPYGCTATAVNTVVVNPTPVCPISVPDTFFCPGDSVALTACTGMNSYQWYKDGTPVGTNSNSYFATTYGEYWVEFSSAAGCFNESNKIDLFLYQKPKADITGDGHVCIPLNGTANFGLSTIYDPNYSYNWYSIPGGATFSPANSSFPWVTITVTGALPQYYQFVVDVTDINTGCMNSDTLCVTFYEEPSFWVTPVNTCEGIPVTLTPSLIDTLNFSYQWNNGATTPQITVSTPGFYSLTITDLMSGCSTTQAAGTIFPKPDLSLFPIGCAELCDPDSLYLYIPLPLNAVAPNNTYSSAYPFITWYDNGNYGMPVGSGPTLAFPADSLNHQISVVVQNSFGCSDTAGVFCLTSSCCELILESLDYGDALCPEVPNGWFTIVLDPASTGGPFNITSIPLVAPFPTTITPGVPLTANNLPPGIYTIVITGPNESCGATYTVNIGSTLDQCCFAAADSLYTKILVNTTYSSDVVWDGKYYIHNNVIVTVTNGAILDVTNVDVVFGECAGIVFTNGALLRSNNSVYRPCEIDGTWKGLRFVGKGEFDNIINECTFKNAEVALYFQEMADGVISSNLFSNCNYGVRVEGNNNFNHPISGNRFVTEQFFPSFNCGVKYSFVNNLSTYGIYSTASRFKQQVSQNEFINTWGQSNPRTYGITQLNGGGVFSNNTFTDLSYSILLNSSQFPTIIENNEIEINEIVNTNLAPVYVGSSTSSIIEINNNEISDNYHQYNCFSAIYARNSSNVSIINNKIDGFQYGIFVNLARNFQISNNEITDSDINGIYFYGKGNYRNFITCNNVKMRSFNNTRGLYAIDLTPLSEVSSNCFNDSYTSMDFRTFTGASLPLIRNNFLYNYNFVGINAVNYTGNIGTLSPSDPGLNTLWSNYNPAIDINSNTNITVADNFGMFNISWPFVQITSNRPYHSTSSCAQQIFNMPSQGNLNVNYTCDNYKHLFTMLSGSGGNYSLSSDYKEQLKSSVNPFADADLILSSIESAQPVLLDEIIGSVTMTENEKSMLKSNYYYRNSDFANARLYMEQFVPAGEDEDDYKALRLYDLDINEHGWNILSPVDISMINQIKDKGSYNSNFAISLLNNSATYRDHIFDVVEMPDVIASQDVKHIEDGTNYLGIRPNPATEKVYVELVHNSPGNCKIQLFDVSGKQVSDISVSFVTGGFELDIRNLKEGFYFVTLTDSESGIIKTGKLVKVK